LGIFHDNGLINSNIFQIAKRIGSDYLEKAVCRKWLAHSAKFNENDKQIDILISGKLVNGYSENDEELQRMIEEGIARKDQEDLFIKIKHDTPDPAVKIEDDGYIKIEDGISIKVVEGPDIKVQGDIAIVEAPRRSERTARGVRVRIRSSETSYVSEQSSGE
jgi:hypothetical protein